jgi:hypothetical protein
MSAAAGTGVAGASQSTSQASSGCSCCIPRRSEHAAEVACALLFAFMLLVRRRSRLNA